MIIDGADSVTQAVLGEIERAPNPRFREVMTALVKHLHAFVREAKLTEDEFHQACEIINAIGQNTNAFHNEAVLMSGSLGVSTLVCLLNNGNNGADRNHREPARPVLAAGFAAHRERRLDHPLADAGRRDVRQRLGQGPRRQAGRRRRGRYLAVLDRRPLREPGPDPGRHEPARQVHHRRRRPFRVPQHPAGGLSDPDQRPGRRSVARAGPPQHAAGASALPDLQGGLQDPHLAGLCAGRSRTSRPTCSSASPRRCSATTSATRATRRRRRASRTPWYTLDYTFTMEPGKAKLPRAPIQDKAKTTEMRPQYLAAVNRAPAMAK